MSKRRTPQLTPEQRSLRAKAAVDASWAHTEDRAARTEPARRAALARFEREVDPHGVLTDEERQRRAASARRSYFRYLALRSARKRGSRQSKPKPERQTTPERQRTGQPAIADRIKAFWVDEDYDREYASDGVSRYWDYLRRRAGQFRWDGMITRDPELFALTAFEIGSPPIMSPGYIRRHPRIQYVTHHRDDYGRYALVVDLAAPLPTGAQNYLGGWSFAGWSEDQGWSPPSDNDRPAAYATLTVRVPISPEWLPKAAYDESGNPSWLPVQLAVQALCTRVSDVLAETLVTFER